jgi:hypothetical protein
MAMAVFLPSLRHDFIFNWDDNVYVINNLDITGFDVENIKQAFTHFYVGNYAPVQIISYMFDYALWGVQPFGFIFSNIILHVLNGVLFWALLCGMGYKRLVAFLATGIFLLHPVQVESVVWVSQRKSLLAMLFFLAAFYTYIRCRAAEGKEGRWLYVASISFFSLALLAKSVVVILPPVLLIYELCFMLPEQRRGVIGRLAPYTVAALAVAVLTYFSQSAGGFVDHHVGGKYWFTFLTMLPILVSYLRLLVWPTGLAALYDPALKSGIDGEVLLALLVVALLLIAGMYLYRNQKKQFFWFAFFFVGLLPVSQIIPLATLMNDRYLYFPLLGVALLLPQLVVDLAERRGVAGKVVLVLFLVALTCLPYLSYQRSMVWQDAITLWRDTVAKTPAAINGWVFMIEAYQHAGRLREIPAPLLQEPQFRAGVVKSVQLYLDKHLAFKARLFLEQLLDAFPGFADGYLLMGRLSALSGDNRAAALYYAKGFEIDPGASLSDDVFTLPVK